MAQDDQVETPVMKSRVSVNKHLSTKLKTACYPLVNNSKLPLWCKAQHVRVYQSNTLRYVFAPHLCHTGQTHRFRRSSTPAAGALEYPKKNSRNGNKEEFYFNFTLLYFILKVHAVCVAGLCSVSLCCLWISLSISWSTGMRNQTQTNG